MIGFGLRLTLNGGKDAVTRLVMIAAAVAVGVAMLLVTLGGINALNAQNARYAWLETSFLAPGRGPSNTASTDPLWWLLRPDYFHGKTIARVDLAATGPHSPLPPGLTALPGPGQFYASPALTTLLNSTPADQLGARFPGVEVGTIGPAALPAPNSLIIVIGRRVDALSTQGLADQVTSISTTAPSSCHNGCAIGVGIDDRGIALILAVVAAALLFPVLIFIGSATRLSAARREQRFAALRLVGATPHQLSIISAVESTVAAAAGVAVGFGLFFAVRPAVAGIPFTGAPFFTGDLSLSLLDVLLVAVGVPLAAAVAARLALRRVQISPLGVSRRVTPRPPRAWRLIPVLAGLVELSCFAALGRPGSTSGQVLAYLSGILLTMAGLVIAGPWLTMIGARVLARRTGQAPTLIAGRRLADNPHAGFRAVSGLALAVFVGSCALGVITTIVAYNDGPSADPATKSALVDRLYGPDPASGTAPVPQSTLGRLAKTRGVESVIAIHSAPDPHPTPGRPPPDVVSCAELTHAPAFGRCAPGVQTAAFRPDYGGSFTKHSSHHAVTWPNSGLTENGLKALPVTSAVVYTDSSAGAIERARTVIELTDPGRFPPTTVGELNADNARQIAGYQRLADVVILTSLPIAGCSLAVSVAGGLSERKRPFSLLRLTGVPLAMLRRVVAIETAVPLLITAVVSAGAGFLAAYLFLRAQLTETLQAPGLAYYGIVLAGLAASLAVIASTLPLLKRITGPEAARND